MNVKLKKEKLYEPIIVNSFKVQLAAEHVPTCTPVLFPTFHVLVEEELMSNGEKIYVATCLEYYLVHDGSKKLEVINGLFSIMFEYFFTLMQDGNEDMIWKSLSYNKNEDLWAKLRRYQAKEFEEDLNFLKASFTSDEKTVGELSYKLKSKNKNYKLAKEKNEKNEKNEYKKLNNNSTHEIKKLQTRYERELKEKEKIIASLKEKFEKSQYKREKHLIEAEHSSYIPNSTTESWKPQLIELRVAS